MLPVSRYFFNMAFALWGVGQPFKALFVTDAKVEIAWLRLQWQQKKYDEVEHPDGDAWKFFVSDKTWVSGGRGSSGATFSEIGMPSVYPQVVVL